MAEGIVLSMILTSHIGWQGKFNDVHPTISYNFNSYSIGAFRNSYNRTSLFASKINKIGDVSIQYGFASNYDSKVVPMLIVKKPIVEHVNLIASPSYDKTSKQPAMVIGLEFSY